LSETIKKAADGRRRTQIPAMRIRVVYVEPSEDERAAAERVWAMLLGGPEVRTHDDRPAGTEEQA